MDESLKMFEKTMNESFKAMQNLNTGMEKELNYMYQAAFISEIISFIAFIAIIYFIYKNHSENKELERKNKYLEYRITQLENHIEETTGKKFRNTSIFDF